LTGDGVTTTTAKLTAEVVLPRDAKAANLAVIGSTGHREHQQSRTIPSNRQLRKGLQPLGGIRIPPVPRGPVDDELVDLGRMVKNRCSTL
jgi:hypothetical protein